MIAEPPTVTAPRILRLSALDADAAQLVHRLIRLSITGLPRMRHPGDVWFAFARKRTSDAVPAAGRSLRYSAITLLGALHLDPQAQRQVLGCTAREYAEQLVRPVAIVPNLGDAALVLWSAAESGVDRLEAAVARIRTLLDQDSGRYVVEHAWVLSAAAAARDRVDCADLADRARSALLGCFSHESGIFPHHVTPAAASRFRRHVGCFADQVYPIQALARDALATGEPRGLEAASRCGRRICDLQGAAGQWWWHYDARSGEVVEGFPVYTVHQDSMGPMALFDLHEAGGPDLLHATHRGLRWMTDHPELPDNLIEDDLGLIWRSIRRADPAKLVRKVRAAAGSIVPGMRLRMLDHVFPPARVDYEDRPYHLGWILHAWLGGLSRPTQSRDPAGAKGRQG